MSKNKEEIEIIDPEQHFLHTLIRRWDEIGALLYNPRIVQNVTTRKAMMAFISRLPNNERETVFKKAYRALDIISVGTGGSPLRSFYAKNYIEIYGEISKYLGETYFRNFRMAKPKHRSGKLEVKY
jgi:hypothetical protein